jgi:hypothetical protein
MSNYHTTRNAIAMYVITVYSLFKDAFSATHTTVYRVEWKGDRWMMICKWRGRERLWPNLRYYSVIWLEVPRKAKKPLVQDNLFRAEIWTRDLPITKQEC